MSAAPSILVVEDEEPIAEFVAMYLRGADYRVTTAATGAAALERIRADRPALVVLDLGLPDMDGLETCRELREKVPVVVVSARDEDVDRIIGLEVGAADYLTKPFNPRELLARIRTILRRSVVGSTGVIRFGDMTVDANRREVVVGGGQVQLAPKEFDLLWELLRSRGKVLSRADLLTGVWGYQVAVDTRTIDVHVRQLRAKLDGHCPIRTVWGQGYTVQ